jgi:hypothetical protein
MLLVYGSLDPGFFAPDVYSYQVRGERLAEAWRGLAPPVERFGLQRGYEVLNALFIMAYGEPHFAAALLNLFASLWTCVVAHRLAEVCFGATAARVTATLCAVFPSLVLWSVLNVRDALATLLVAALVLAAVRIAQRPRGVDLLLLVGGALALSTLRDYMGLLVLAGLGLGYAVSVRPDRIVATTVAGTAVILTGFVLLERFQILEPAMLDDPLASAAALRRTLQQDFGGGLAGSAYAVDIDTTTLSGALRYLPLGLAYFLLAPFPWAIESTLQLAALPEVLLWYAVIPFTLLGLRRALVRPRSGVLLIVGVLVVSVTSYALVEGSFGTAYRHRSQFLPLFFVFAGAGLARWWGGRRRRDRRRGPVAVAAP